MSNLQYEQEFMSPYVAEVFQSFIGSFLSKLYNHLTEEMCNQQFAEALMEQEYQVMEQVQNIIEQQNIKVDFQQLATIEELNSAKDAYVEIAYLCAEFQKEAANLLEKYFPAKYPDYFMNSLKLLKPLEERIEELDYINMELKQQSDQYASEISLLSEQYNELYLTQAALQETALLKQEKNDQLHEKLVQQKQISTRFERTAEELKKQVEKKQDFIDALYSENVNLSEKITELKNEKVQYSAQLESSVLENKELQKSLKTIKDENTELLMIQEASEEKLINLEKVNLQLNELMEMMEASNSKLLNDNKVLQRKAEEVFTNLKSKEDRLSELTEELAELKKQVNVLTFQQDHSKVVNDREEPSETATDNEQIKKLKSMFHAGKAIAQDQLENFLNKTNETKETPATSTEELKNEIQLLTVKNTALQESMKVKEAKLLDSKHKFQKETEDLQEYKKHSEEYIEETTNKYIQSKKSIAKLKNDIQLLEEKNEKLKMNLESSSDIPSTDLASSYNKLKIRYTEDLKKMRMELSSVLEENKRLKKDHETGGQGSMNEVSELREQLEKKEKDLKFYKGAVDQIGMKYKELLLKNK